MGGGAGRDRRVRAARVAVPILLAAYVAAIYVTTVLAGEVFLGRSGGAGFGLTVLAAAVAALTLEPVGARLRRRLPVLPQDRLARLASGAVAAADVTEVLQSTARRLQEGLGASAVEIRPFAGASGGYVARWPAEPAGDPRDHAEVTPLVRAGTALGEIQVNLPPGTRLSPRDQTLLAGVGEHVTTILHTARLRAALRTTVAEAERRSDDLRLSRQRILLTSQAGRARVERDIHDGAQQHLVALAVHLGLLRTMIADEPCEAVAIVETVRSSAESALDALDELSHGLYPARLADSGLAVALEHAGSSGPLPVRVVGHGLPRADPDVEAAVYFCCVEALQNAAKHAQASRVDLRLASRDGMVTFAVTDDGRGFVPSRASAGAGTQNMRDRIEALGGSLDVTSGPGAGTTVSGRVPAFPGLGLRAVPAPRSHGPGRGSGT